MKYNIRVLCLQIFMGGCMLAVMQSCNKQNGELGTPATASFTVSPVAGKPNTFALSSKSQNAFRYQWNFGDGSALRAGKQEDTAYYPKKGTYLIKLYAYGNGGYTTDSQRVVVATDDFSSIANNPTFQLLIAKTWKLDPNPTAKAVIVGTEGNPGQYYAGGPLADCQMDDTYKFSFSSGNFSLVYGAAGATFNGGNIAPNYSCGADLSYTTPYTFAPTADGDGIATITIPGFTPPTRFIGTTDITSNNFRIISINANSMVLRAGKKDETVFQFKFIGQ